MLQWRGSGYYNTDKRFNRPIYFNISTLIVLQVNGLFGGVRIELVVRYELAVAVLYAKVLRGQAGERVYVLVLVGGLLHVQYGLFVVAPPLRADAHGSGIEVVECDWIFHCLGVAVRHDIVPAELRRALVDVDVTCGVRVGRRACFGRPAQRAREGSGRRARRGRSKLLVDLLHEGHVGSSYLPRLLDAVEAFVELFHDESAAVDVVVDEYCDQEDVDEACHEEDKGQV